MPFPQQRLQGRPNATTIDAPEIAAEDGLVDLPRAARIRRQQLAVELRRGALGAGDPAARDRHAPSAFWGRDRPLETAIPIPATSLGALMRFGAECRGELLGEGGI